MIVIYGIKAHLNPIKAELSSAIHHCMTQVLGLPDDKRAHRIIPLDSENFYVPGGRSEARALIEINLMAGRSVDTQKSLIKLLFNYLEQTLGIAPIDLEITIKEQAPYQWGFRGMTGDEAKDLSYRINV